jgi:hypothetical protein
MNRSIRGLALGSTAVLLVAQLSAAAVLGADIQPRTVDEIIFPGGSVEIEKTVTTPELPPVVDICVLEDETGSFFDDIGNLNTAASGLYDDIVNAFSMRNYLPSPSEPSGHDQFFVTFGRYGEVSWRVPGEMTAMLLRRYAAEQVQHTELMITLTPT